MSILRCNSPSKRLEIITAPIFPLLFKMSIPTIIGMLVMAIYNLTDAFFVGMLNNVIMLGVIGLIYNFTSIIQAIGFWFGYGSGNIMSKKIGENDLLYARKCSSFGILLAILIGIVLSIICWIFLPYVSTLIGAHSLYLQAYTIEYLKIIILTIPFCLYSITLYNQIRLCGNSKAGMFGVLAGMIINMIFDPLLIFWYKFGFIGAAYATLLGQVVTAILLTLLGKKEDIFIRVYQIMDIKNILFHIVIGGLPNFARQIITSVALIILNNLAACYGASLLAGITISSRIMAFAYMIMIGWSQGFQPICAMNYGAKQFHRVKLAFKYTLIVSTLFLIITALFLFIYAEDLVSTMSGQNNVIQHGTIFLRFGCITLPLMGYYALSSMFMQNIGKYWLALIISTARQGFFFIPLVYYLVDLYGVVGIYVIQSISDICSFILALFLVYKTKYVLK